jgi:hypothetical protein
MNTEHGKKQKKNKNDSRKRNGKQIKQKYTERETLSRHSPTNHTEIHCAERRVLEKKKKNKHNYRARHKSLSWKHSCRL